eukprot:9590500-Prorocentrum_lima.AAC.1
MTSSLVGSEMCIRDRLDDGMVQTLAEKLDVGVEIKVESFCFCRCSCFQAVSYTHLTLPTICSV